jgi:predicted lipoprotein with Yx(FWY)xxD motif
MQPSDGTPTLRVANTGLGDVLIDSDHRTVYLFKKDQRAKSACFGACAHQWPPVRVTGKPTGGSGAKAAMIGTTRRSDGPPQLTYNGHPLYLFPDDNAPEATNGQGVTAFGAQWFVVSPADNQVSGRSTAGRSNGY